MKLEYLLKGKNQIYVAEYIQEWFPQAKWFCGGCFYIDGRLVPLDGGSYSLDTEVIDYKWRNATDIEVVIYK